MGPHVVPMPGTAPASAGLHAHARIVIGGKAAALAALARAGEAIPAWFAISAADADPGPELSERVAAALREICPDGRAVAVRSSGVDEDGSAHSFAGQLESFLDVSHADVMERIARVRASGESERIKSYRQSSGLNGPAPAPGVLIQRMVNAKWAGVAFSADPVTGDRSRALVAAVKGLGDGLVSGERDADTFGLDLDGSIVSRQEASEPSGIPLVLVSQVAAMARRVSDHFGTPQDIEWAVEGETIFLLQARPITTLKASTGLDGPPIVWDNSNITESYGGIVLPLTFSFARKAYEEVYRAFCRVMAVPREVIEASDHVYANMLGLIQGRVYYNMLNWYRLIAMLPGFRFNRRFMEQMMGVSAALSDELAAQVVQSVRPPSATDRFRDLARLARTVARMIRNHWALSRRIGAFNQRLQAALATTPAQLKTMRADELAAYYRELQHRLLRHWDAPIVNDFLAMIFHGVLRKLCAGWVDAADEGLHNDLVRDVGGVISTEPAVKLREMSVIVARDETLTRTLQSEPVAAMVKAVNSHPELQRLYAEYLARFADRCLEELKLESATLEDDPTTLLRSVGHMAQRLRTGAVLASGDREARSRAEARARAVLRWRPLRRLVFNWVARNARARIRDRENLRFERTRVFGRVRRVFMEIGDRLQQRGVLAHARDVFHLEVDEILGFIEGTATTTDLAGLVSLRRVQYGRCGAQAPPPDRFETRGMVNPFAATTERAAAVPDASAGESRRGIGCCAGVVRGLARVIRDPRGAELRPGEILVAERTDPGWVMLFPAAAGILVERGSLLSHSAIVSRELGVPGIVSIPGLTSWLRDGDEVELDGSSGIVTRLRQGTDA
jgi:rifampicin phosphotransferase